MAAEAHDERIEARVPASVKAEFVRAAEMEGRSVSDVLTEYMRRATDEIYARHRRITLASADWETFTQALKNLPEPGENLTRAAARYRERYGS